LATGIALDSVNLNTFLRASGVFLPHKNNEIWAAPSNLSAAISLRSGTGTGARRCRVVVISILLLWGFRRVATPQLYRRLPSERVRSAEQPAKRQRGQSKNLFDLLADAELWHSPDREGFASIAINGHVENWPVRSKSFKLWLLGRYFEETGAVPGGQALVVRF
jgi:hypothetical protein